MRPILAPLATAALLMTTQAACAAQTTAAGGPPFETRAANTQYKPAFEGQTRAPRSAAIPALSVTTVASGLRNPWGLEFLPDGRMLVTEKAGAMRIVARDGTLGPDIAGVPAVDSAGQGGLLDVAVDPDFASNRTIFFTYAEPRGGATNGTTLARAVLVDGPTPRLDNLQIIFRQTPAWESRLHFGSRIVFAADGTLFLALGERSNAATRVQAQDLGGHLGKVVRINKDGTVPRDNPFVGRADAKPEIWSYGLRNIQAAALQPGTNLLWTVEHGPRGGDELNQPEAGKNYGWPVITYGIEYNGNAMPGAITAQAGMEQPVYYWDPVIAPMGMTFYTGDLFPAWKGSILVGGHSSRKLVRLVLDGRKVVSEDWLLTEEAPRIRDVKQGPDGAVYVLTNETDGKVLRVAPR
jgi:glucose/arabinose dehydrogenase